MAALKLKRNPYNVHIGEVSNLYVTIQEDLIGGNPEFKKGMAINVLNKETIKRYRYEAETLLEAWDEAERLVEEYITEGKHFN